jgi:hypothetical protein
MSGVNNFLLTIPLLVCSCWHRQKQILTLQYFVWSKYLLTIFKCPIGQFFLPWIENCKYLSLQYMKGYQNSSCIALRPIRSWTWVARIWPHYHSKWNILYSKLTDIWHAWRIWCTGYMLSESCMRKTLTEIQYKVKTTYFHFNSCMCIFLGKRADWWTRDFGYIVTWT